MMFRPYFFVASCLKASKPLPMVLMSMKKRDMSRSGSCSFATLASLMAYMQQTEEQNPFPHVSSLDPTHCRNAIFFGVVSSEGLTMWPSVGPAAHVRRSNSRLVTTSGKRPYPKRSSTSSSTLPKPGVRTTPPTLSSRVFGCCEKSMAPAVQVWAQRLHVS